MCSLGDVLTASHNGQRAGNVWEGKERHVREIRRVNAIQTSTTGPSDESGGKGDLEIREKQIARREECSEGLI